MAVVKAIIRVEGFKGSIEERALVDTGATLTLLDRRAADELVVKPTGRRMELTVADGHELAGDLAIVNKLVVEGEELPGAHVLLIEFSRELTEKLKASGLSDRCIVGASTLEILGLTPNVITGKVEKVGAFII